MLFARKFFAAHVCNACEKQNVRPFRKRFYVAVAAQSNCRRVMRDARREARTDEAMTAYTNSAPMDSALRRGQSIRAAIDTRSETLH